jgi:hypothetical protein
MCHCLNHIPELAMPQNLTLVWKKMHLEGLSFNPANNNLSNVQCMFHSKQIFLKTGPRTIT